MMLAEVVVSLTFILLTTIVYQVLTLIVRNYRAHQFFKQKSPNLPVLPNPSLLSGHVRELVYTSRVGLKINKYHEIYGETFGYYDVGRPMVSTVDLDLIKTIVIDEPNDHNDRCNLDIALDELEIDCLPFVEHEQWQRMRRAIAPAFTNHKIKSPNVQAEIRHVIEIFAKSIEWRLDRAREDRGESFIVIDGEDIFHRYALDLVFKCFYKQDNMVDYYAEKDFWVDLIDRSLRTLLNPLVFLCIVFPVLKPSMQWLLMQFHPQGLLRRTLMSFIRVQARINLNAKKQLKSAMRRVKAGNFNADNYELADGSRFIRNMIDYVIDQFHEEKLTEREYFNSTFFLFFAANKTSADALSRLFYHLAIHQDVQIRLRESILRDGIESEYLVWVLNESMRLFPPALIGCSRTISRDIETKSGLIPAGTMVITPTHTIARLTKYWGEDADQFKPERWRKSRSFNPVQYLVFGAGKRGCPGKDLAMHEMKMLLDVLLRRFKFDKAWESTGPIQYESPLMIFNVSDSPTYVKISRLEH